MVEERAWLRLATGVSITASGAMMLAAATGYPRLVPIGAGAYTLAIIAIAVGLDRASRTSPGSELRGTDLTAIELYSRLLARVYLWGALAMQGLYTTQLTGLRWQHAWQYALAMALLALSARTFARQVSSPDAADRRQFVAFATPLSLVHALGGAAGLMFLVLSGKIASMRADWAANQVFFWGAAAVTVVAAIGLRAQARAEND